MVRIDSQEQHPILDPSFEQGDLEISGCRLRRVVGGAQFASTGNADAGLISLTSALTLTAQGHYVAVPQNAYQPILQGAIAVKGGANARGAAAFLKYLHSPAVAQQLERGGLAPAR
jgi:molybdate transport system substrate-binding protein